MEIKVGEYVRTFNGEIAKIIGTDIEFDCKVYKTDQYIQSSRDFYVFENDSGIVKHSKNIIDLIEIGDYVNGEYVMCIDEAIEKYGAKTIITECNNRYFGSQIISIVTKQQFSNMEYRV